VETDRLLLRPWREDDVVELQRLFSDAAVRGGRHLPPHRIARIAEASLRQWRVNGFGPWAAIDRRTGSWIGRVGLDELDEWPEPERVEVGFELRAASDGEGGAHIPGHALLDES
jgi:RimJ/RimL family protein N-acetyltransferase